VRGSLPPLLLVLYGFGIGAILHRPLGAPRPLAVAVAFIGVAIVALTALHLAGGKSLMEFLEAWQTGIGALIGFTGLVLVEAARAEAERLRAERERAQARASLQAAVTSDVRWMSRELRRLLENLRELESTAVDGIIKELSASKAAELAPAEPALLRSLLPHLGSLDGHQSLLDLVRCHAEVIDQLRRLAVSDAGLSTGELARVEAPAGRALQAAEAILGPGPGQLARSEPLTGSRTQT
jgi:hypothetical protein